jgi:hypothetical protein
MPFSLFDLFELPSIPNMVSIIKISSYKTLHAASAFATRKTFSFQAFHFLMRKIATSR